MILVGRIAHYLNQPETQHLLAEGEAQCAYPQAAWQKLHQLGLPAFLLVPTIAPAGDMASSAVMVATLPPYTSVTVRFVALYS